ncbi:MAG: DUF2061 domain-containing protein, partial [Bacteroidota bacterium]
MKSRKRHIAKTVTWRIIATGTTFLLTIFFFREDPNATEKASWVAVSEAILKMVFYYYHERVWFSIKMNLRSSIRHLFKTITWRVIASLTTFVLALLFFKDDPSAVEKATGVALIESILKMLFYYLHERVWHK